jgi:CDP-diacylglycerol--glycerol-3-phosphate 3-phosphatidyltransferase
MNSQNLQSGSIIIPLPLYRRWWITAVLFTLTLIGGYLWLTNMWPQPELAQQWALLAGAVLAHLLWVFWRGLKDNHRPAETALLSTLGTGNGLTLIRGAGVALLAGFLFLPRPTTGFIAWVPAILYTVISILDYLDGYAARVTNHITRLGQQLDGVCDALGMLVAATLVVWYGQLPPIFLLAGLSVYLFQLGVARRKRAGLPVFPLPPSRDRRVLSGFQMGFFTVALWPVFSPPATTLAGIIFVTPVLFGFGCDWLVVSGRWDPAGTHYRQFRRMLPRLFNGWLLLALRAGLAVLAIITLRPLVVDTSARQLLLLLPGGPLWLADFFGLLAVVAVVMLLLGILSRVAALMLLAPTAVLTVTVGVTPVVGLLLAGTIIVSLSGGGYLALWSPDDTFVTVRAGGRPRP